MFTEFCLGKQRGVGEMLIREVKVKSDQIPDETCFKALAQVEDGPDGSNVVIARSEHGYGHGSLPMLQQWLKVVQEVPFAMCRIGDGLVTAE